MLIGDTDTVCDSQLSLSPLTTDVRPDALLELTAMMLKDLMISLAEATLYHLNEVIKSLKRTSLTAASIFNVVEAQTSAVLAVSYRYHMSIS